MQATTIHVTYEIWLGNGGEKGFILLHYMQATTIHVTYEIWWGNGWVMEGRKVSFYYITCRLLLYIHV